MLIAIPIIGFSIPLGFYNVILIPHLQPLRKAKKKKKKQNKNKGIFVNIRVSLHDNKFLRDKNKLPKFSDKDKDGILFSSVFFFFVFKEHTFNLRILNIKRKMIII